MARYSYPCKLQLEVLSEYGEWEQTHSFVVLSPQDLKKKMAQLSVMNTIDSNIFRFFVVTKSINYEKVLSTI
jgi:hypothetical protein